MPTTLTSKGQVTIPKRIRDALRLLPGTAVEFSVNAGGARWCYIRPACPRALAACARTVSTPCVAAPKCPGAQTS
jgi:AbrB family looped-hinge helix DNA binding protein